MFPTLNHNAMIYPRICIISHNSHISISKRCPIPTRVPNFGNDGTISIRAHIMQLPNSDGYIIYKPKSYPFHDFIRSHIPRNLLSVPLESTDSHLKIILRNTQSSIRLGMLANHIFTHSTPRIVPLFYPLENHHYVFPQSPSEFT